MPVSGRLDLLQSHVASSAPEVVKASHQLHSLALQYEVSTRWFNTCCACLVLA